MTSPTPAVHFSAAASVVLDATGQGQASVGPPGVDWIVNLTSVSTSTAVKKAAVNTYRNAVSQATLIDTTLSGNADTSDTRILLQPGEQLVCQWTGGDVGAKAFLHCSGMSYPAGQGARNL